MGVIAEGIPRGCQGLFTPGSLGYPLSVFNKNSTIKKEKKRKEQQEKEGKSKKKAKHKERGVRKKERGKGIGSRSVGTEEDRTSY